MSQSPAPLPLMPPAYFRRLSWHARRRLADLRAAEVRAAAVAHELAYSAGAPPLSHGAHEDTALDRLNRKALA